jgi:hypothetical protein
LSVRCSIVGSCRREPPWVISWDRCLWKLVRRPFGSTGHLKKSFGPPFKPWGSSRSSAKVVFQRLRHRERNVNSTPQDNPAQDGTRGLSTGLILIRRITCPFAR